MKSQMTRFALGAKCGLPSGGVHSSLPSAAVSPARATPSRWSMAPSTRPVNPIPRSDRKVRLGKRRQLQSVGRWVIGSPNGHEIVVVEEDVYEPFAGALARIG